MQRKALATVEHWGSILRPRSRTARGVVVDPAKGPGQVKLYCDSQCREAAKVVRRREARAAERLSTPRDFGPGSRNPAKRARLLELLAEGYQLQAAARRAGLSVRTAYGVVDAALAGGWSPVRTAGDRWRPGP